MTAKEIKSYVRYIADWRLTQLKLETGVRQFRRDRERLKQLKAHPLPWLVEILNGVEHANFFEQRATEYSKGASRGRWDGDEGVWATFDQAQSGSLNAWDNRSCRQALQAARRH